MAIEIQWRFTGSYTWVNYHTKIGSWHLFCIRTCTSLISMQGLLFCMHPAIKRRRYIVTSSLIGWEHTKMIPAMYAVWFRIVTCDCASVLAQFWYHNDACSGMSFRSPVVICGEPGAGKTSVMAKVASLLPAWLDDGQDEDIKIILRFLGTSTSSSTTKELLKSLCSQIHHINGNKRRIGSIPTVSPHC